jgi:hypothetical protein
VRVDKHWVHAAAKPVAAKAVSIAALAMIALVSFVAHANAAFPTSVNATPGETGAVKAPAVAADSSTGGSVIAWLDASTKYVMIRRIAADGTPGAIQNVSGIPNLSAQMGVGATSDPEGNVTVAWIRNIDGHLLAVRIPAGGIGGSPIDVSQGGVALSTVVNPAADGSGVVHAVWRRNSDSHAMTATLSPAGVVSSAVDVSGTDADAVLWGTAPSVAADAAGNAYFSFHRNTDCHIMLRKQNVGGAFDGAVDVTGTPDKAVGDTSPSVAVAADHILVVWHRDGDIYDHADDTTFYSFFTAGSPGPLTALSGVGEVSMNAISAAGGPDGSFVVSWQRQTTGHVFVRRIDSAGQPGEVTDLSADTEASNADSAPSVAVSSNATAYAIFSRASDKQIMLTSSAGSFKPPVPSPEKSIPAESRLRFAPKPFSLSGKKLAVRLSCSTSDHVACVGKLTIKSSGKKSKTYGTANVKIADGKTAVVKVKLSARARSLLRRQGKLGFSASVALNSGGGGRSGADLPGKVS